MQPDSSLPFLAKDLATPLAGESPEDWVALPEPPIAGKSLNLIESRQSSASVYQGRLLKVYRDQVRTPDGTTAGREYVVHPGAALIVPMWDDGQVVIERQFRYPLQDVFIEFPAGKLDPNESSWQTAQRELREEAGLLATQWFFIGTIHPLIAYSTERIDLFLARGLSRCERQLDPGECLEIDQVPFEQMLKWVQDGSITDAKTVAATLWLAAAQHGHWPLKVL